MSEFLACKSSGNRSTAKSNHIRMPLTVTSAVSAIVPVSYGDALDGF